MYIHLDVLYDTILCLKIHKFVWVGIVITDGRCENFFENVRCKQSIMLIYFSGSGCCKKSKISIVNA